MTALEKVVDKLGSYAALGELIGRSREAVRHWEQLPAEFVLKVEEATGVSRHALRPDIYPLERRRRA